jgi:S-adenosylmethionine-diacylgycerolhomoserine-N-methlytransferase
MNTLQTHRETMTGYYARHSLIYDATRWAFLFDRDAIIKDLRLAGGETVVEVGCGTGYNLPGIVRRVGRTGKVMAVDCSTPMIEKCAERIKEQGWGNVNLIDREYGNAPVTGGRADVVLLSYSLSMIPSWMQVLECAAAELKPGGRIGVVDFCLQDRNPAPLAFAQWMARNHVMLDRPCVDSLFTMFRPTTYAMRKALRGLWSFYRFVGERRWPFRRGQRQTPPIEPRNANASRPSRAQNIPGRSQFPEHQGLTVLREKQDGGSSRTCCRLKE